MSLRLVREKILFSQHVNSEICPDLLQWEPVDLRSLGAASRCRGLLLNQTLNLEVALIRSGMEIKISDYEIIVEHLAESLSPSSPNSDFC